MYFILLLLFAFLTLILIEYIDCHDLEPVLCILCTFFFHDFVIMK